MDSVIEEAILISIVMPVYNGEPYLKEAIESILNQTYTNFEFIIINDASTDKSEKTITQFKDNRIRYYKNKANLNIAKTLNRGLSLAKGKYIARMDQDDKSYPTRLQEQLTFMETNCNIGLCGTQISFFGEANGIWPNKFSDEEIRTSLLYENVIAHPSVVIRRDILNNLEKWYDEDLVQAEDYDLWRRLLQVTQAVNIKRILLDYRIHNNNMSSGGSSFKNRMSKIKDVRRYALETALEKPFNKIQSFIWNKLYDSNPKIGLLEFFIFIRIIKEVYSNIYRNEQYSKEVAIEFIEFYLNLAVCSQPFMGKVFLDKIPKSLLKIFIVRTD